jgi:pimeloyl-ACP methyl ester carboxylesterase
LGAVPHVTVNGLQLYYEEYGAGAPILGIHGGGSSAIFWEDAAERLSEIGRVIIYDRRGCMRSERPEPYETTTVAEHADDAHALLRALDADQAIAIGRSYGGTVALELALSHPDSIRAVALLEAGSYGFSPEYDRWFATLHETIERAVIERGPDAVGEITLREVFGAWDELPQVWRDVFKTNGPALLAEIRGKEKLTDVTLLGEFGKPTLIVTADDSPLPLQRGSEAYGRALPHARPVRVGGGHAIDPAGPDVLAFVAEVLAE